MLRSWLFLFSLWVLSTGAAAAPTLDAGSTPPVGHSAAYQVWGSSLKRPRDDRPWSEVCCDSHTAQRRLREILNDYSEEGLLAAASDKPRGLRIIALEPRLVPFAVRPLEGMTDHRRESGNSIVVRRRASRLRFGAHI